MSTNNQMHITKDVANKKVLIVRKFEAAVEDVWKYWTSSDLLDSWWAPKPWKAETKKMDFREGGMWLYAMVGPAGERHCARIDYKTIDAPKSFTAVDSFCDEDGNKTEGFPSMQWKNVFKKSDSGTTVEVEITFASEEDMNKLFEMGFEQGFSMALGNLDELVSK